MKKVITALIVVMGVVSAVSVSAQSDEFKAKGIMYMLAQKHDLTSHQQELAVELFKSAKNLKQVFAKPKDDMKAFMETLVEAENIDVEMMMQEYKQWQAGVDAQFEVVLTNFAALHHNLSVEQRRAIVESIKKKTTKSESE